MDNKKLQKSNYSILLSTLMIVFGMLMLAFSSVPLYNLFCKVTGFGGKTTVAVSLPKELGQNDIDVFFNTDVAPNLKFEFMSLQKKVTTRTGSNALAFFKVKNLTNEPIKAVAIYNSVPHRAGIYFNKMTCFCFSEMILKANEEIELPVSFFIDPKIEKDPYLKDTRQIFLSYSFMKVED